MKEVWVRDWGAQQVVLVLLDGLHAHPVLEQQRLVARGVARRGQELQVSVSAAQKEASPEGVKEYVCQVHTKSDHKGKGGGSETELLGPKVEGL